MANNIELLKILIKEAYQSLNNNNIQVYLDMDGVIADFDKATKESKEIVAAKQEMIGVLRGMPELAKLSEDELKARLKGEQKEPSMKALKKAFREYLAVKYGIVGKQGFFINLEPMPGAEELIKGIKAITGNLPHILTAPVRSSHCEPEKKQWMYKHFNGMFNEFYCDSDKGRFAQKNPNNVLIDDRMKNIVPFERNGGQVIFYKGNYKDALNKLKQIVAVESNSEENE